VSLSMTTAALRCTAAWVYSLAVVDCILQQQSVWRARDRVAKHIPISTHESTTGDTQ